MREVDILVPPTHTQADITAPSRILCACAHIECDDRWVAGILAVSDVFWEGDGRGGDIVRGAPVGTGGEVFGEDGGEVADGGEGEEAAGEEGGCVTGGD